jgi:hypothetical protein
VQVQTGFNGGSQPGQVYAPVYDSTGNLAVMTGNGGKVPRYAARTEQGKYIDPATGTTGTRGAVGHQPMVDDRPPGQ